jgi:hypothetical protein
VPRHCIATVTFTHDDTHPHERTHPPTESASVNVDTASSALPLFSSAWPRRISASMSTISTEFNSAQQPHTSIAIAMCVVPNPVPHALSEPESLIFGSVLRFSKFLFDALARQDCRRLHCAWPTRRHLKDGSCRRGRVMGCCSEWRSPCRVVGSLPYDMERRPVC